MKEYYHSLEQNGIVENLVAKYCMDSSLCLRTNLMRKYFLSFFSSFQSLSCVHSATPWTAARQASLSMTNSWSLPRLMSIESVIPSNHLILSHPFLLLPSIFPSIRVFSKESVLPIRWPNCWSFSFCIVLPMNTQD